MKIMSVLILSVISASTGWACMSISKKFRLSGSSFEGATMSVEQEPQRGSVIIVHNEPQAKVWRHLTTGHICVETKESGQNKEKCFAPKEDVLMSIPINGKEVAVARVRALGADTLRIESINLMTKESEANQPSIDVKNRLLNERLPPGDYRPLQETGRSTTFAELESLITARINGQSKESLVNHGITWFIQRDKDGKVVSFEQGIMPRGLSLAGSETVDLSQNTFAGGCGSKIRERARASADETEQAHINNIIDDLLKQQAEN